MAEKGIILNFLWILWHTSRLKPLSRRTRLVKQYTTLKEYAHFVATLDIPVAWSHYLSVPDLLNHLPQIRQIEPLCCTLCGYCGHTSNYISLCILVEQFTTIMMDKVFILHFLGILRHAWGHYLSIPDLLNNVPSIRTLGPFICTFWGYSRHTSRLKPLHISLYTCWTVYHIYDG